jgi:hypothetical protein
MSNNKVIVFIALMLFSSFGVGMSIFDAGKVCTSSKMTGVILKDGKPVKGATITRMVDYQEKREDKTITDDTGRFELPMISELRIVNFLPQEFVVGQLIHVEYQGEKYKIWEGVKRSKEINSEAQGKNLDVVCELDSEQESINFDGHFFISRCKWDVIPEEMDTGF